MHSIVQTNKQNGFSLLELIITVAIIGIIAGIAGVSYNNYVMKSRRAQAQATLMDLQLSEEKWRASNPSYGDLGDLGSGTTTEGGYYTLTIANNDATKYTITATAQGNQANDAQDGQACTTLSLAVSGGVDARTPAACW